MDDVLVWVGRDDASLARHLAAGLSAVGVSRLQVVVLNSGPVQRPGMVESIYRRLDGLLFHRRMAVLPAGYVHTGTDELDPLERNGATCDSDIDPTFVDVASIEQVCARFQPAVVLDLTGTIARSRCRGAVHLGFQFGESGATRSLRQAVRDRIGVHHGVLKVSVAHDANSGASRPVFVASAYLDHRSLQRSAQLVALKLAPIALAASKRAQRRVYLSMPAIGEKPPARSRTAVGLLAKAALAVGQKLLGRVQWQIRLYRNGRPGTTLGQLWVTLKPPRDQFWADPFVISNGGGAVVYFEALRYREGRGYIACVEVKADGTYGEPITVLDRPWHQSYPYVFEAEGVWYMVPESGTNLSVTLFRCVEFPSRWEEVATLIEGVALFDASLVQWQGRWWLFATHGVPGASTYDELHVYWSRELLGPWRPHGLNPVKVDAGTARPAGAPFVVDGRLIRPVQDCRNRYGDAVVFQEVIHLDEDDFLEVDCDIGSIGEEMASMSPLHTYNVERGVTAIDCAHIAFSVSF